MKGFLLTFVALPFALTAARCGELGNNPPFDLTTIYGETFHGCRIVKVTPATVDVIYDSGVAKISFDKLDESWKRHFNYNPEKALAYQKKVAARNSVATARLKELRKRQEVAQTKMLELAAARERRQAVAEARRQRAEQEVASTEVQVLPPLAPYPGETTTTAQVPTMPPLGTTYVSEPVYVPPYYPFGYTGGYPVGNGEDGGYPVGDTGYGGYVGYGGYPGYGGYVSYGGYPGYGGYVRYGGYPRYGGYVSYGGYPRYGGYDAYGRYRPGVSTFVGHAPVGYFGPKSYGGWGYRRW